jgi:hypothetical protein
MNFHLEKYFLPYAKKTGNSTEMSFHKNPYEKSLIYHIFPGHLPTIYRPLLK